jgi:hypothetical protein
MGVSRDPVASSIPDPGVLVGQDVPLWSNGQNGGLSTRRSGFDSRQGRQRQCAATTGLWGGSFGSVVRACLAADCGMSASWVRGHLSATGQMHRAIVVKLDPVISGRTFRRHPRKEAHGRLACRRGRFGPTILGRQVTRQLLAQPKWSIWRERERPSRGWSRGGRGPTVRG